MRHITLTVPDEEFAPLMKVLRSLPFQLKAKAAPAPPAVPAPPRQYTPEQQQWVDDFREALHEVELHQQGKIQLQTLDEYLHELRDSPDQEL